MKNQRIKCLLLGDWFQITTTTSIPLNTTTNLGRRTTISKKWRFYRLSPNTKFLHYSDFLEKTGIREGVEDLPERSKLKSILF